MQKGIRIDEHGENVTLEDFNNNAGADVPEQEKDNQPNKKVSCTSAMILVLTASLPMFIFFFFKFCCPLFLL